MRYEQIENQKQVATNIDAAVGEKMLNCANAQTTLTSDRSASIKDDTAGRHLPSVSIGSFDVASGTTRDNGSGGNEDERGARLERQLS
ncbi:MAG TPA: hypothetical protein V6C86_07370 [Oculatellaceae cyanobacterium]